MKWPLRLQESMGLGVTASLFSFLFTDFASRHNDNLMVSLYSTLYCATLWRFIIVWLCCCGLRRSKHIHDPCAALMYYLLCAEVLMTSAYPLCSTGSTLVLTTGLQTLSTNSQVGHSLFGYLPPLSLSPSHYKTAIDFTSICLFSPHLGLHFGVLPNPYSGQHLSHT
jgi:hypothetical protein